MVSSSNVFVKNVSESARHRRARFHEMAPAAERRRGDLVRNANVQSTTHVVNGTDLIEGAGEVLIDVVFPVTFIQPPIFLYGAELAPGNELVSGSFPVLTAVISYWDVNEPDLALYGITNRKHFRGAQLAVTASGPPTQKMFLHWQFTGLAVSNPFKGRSHVPGVNEVGQVIS